VLEPDPVGRVAVIGLGVMGRGIAEACARGGIATVLIKATPGDHAAAERAIADSLARAVERGKLAANERDAIRARLGFSSRVEDVAGCDLVIESIVEDLAAKRQLLDAVEASAPPAALIGSNTSSLPLRALAAGMRAPERFVGLHFFSPAQVMKLVEIAATDGTASASIGRALAFVERLGKVGVVVADTCGFIVNRLLVPYLLDALAACERGLAAPRAIDEAMRLGCGHPMGPLALADAIGLDVVLAMAETLQRELGDARFVAPAVLRALVARGELGRKSGRGLYDYASASDAVNPELAALCHGESRELGPPQRATASMLRASAKPPSTR
jgi:3-hydroxybutyryl-CoA dehydrogenase